MLRHHTIAETSPPYQRDTGVAIAMPKASPPKVPAVMMRPRRLPGPTMVRIAAVAMISSAISAS